MSDVAGLRERLEGMMREAEEDAGRAESAINLGWHNGYYEACRDIIGELEPIAAALERVEALESALRRPLHVEVIQGVEGPCLAVNSFRVAGPKPWGGGKTIAEWAVLACELARIESSPAPAGTPGGEG